MASNDDDRRFEQIAAMEDIRHGYPGGKLSASEVCAFEDGWGCGESWQERCDREVIEAAQAIVLADKLWRMEGDTVRLSSHLIRSLDDAVRKWEEDHE